MGVSERGVPPLRSGLLREGSNIVPLWGLSTNGLKGQLGKNTVDNQELIVLCQSIGWVE